MKRAAAILVLCLALLAPWGAARADTYVELAWYDRLRSDCAGVDQALAAEEGWDCRYNWRSTVNLEWRPVARLTWLRLLVRSEVTARRAGGERGHFDPVKADLGGGLVARWGAWTVTALGSSRHCLDFSGCESDAYNALILRWEP